MSSKTRSPLKSLAILVWACCEGSAAPERLQDLVERSKTLTPGHARQYGLEISTMLEGVPEVSRADQLRDLAKRLAFLQRVQKIAVCMALSRLNQPWTTGASTIDDQLHKLLEEMARGEDKVLAPVAESALRNARGLYNDALRYYRATNWALVPEKPGSPGDLDPEMKEYLARLTSSKGAGLPDNSVTGMLTSSYTKFPDSSMASYAKFYEGRYYLLCYGFLLYRQERHRVDLLRKAIEVFDEFVSAGLGSGMTPPRMLPDAMYYRALTLALLGECQAALSQLKELENWSRKKSQVNEPQIYVDSFYYTPRLSDWFDLYPYAAQLALQSATSIRELMSLCKKSTVSSRREFCEQFSDKLRLLFR